MVDKPKLTKKEWDALGKLMVPVAMGGSISLGPKMAVKLTALGLTKPFSRQVPPNESDPPWARAKIRIRVVGGYHLTERGRLLYCEWADEQVTEDRIDDDRPRQAETAEKPSCTVSRSDD